MSDDLPYCYPDEDPRKDNCIMPDENRIDPVAAPPAAPAVSPTGKPIIPVAAVPYIAAVVVASLAVVGAPAIIPGLAIPVAVISVAKGVALVGFLVSALSPGLRKQIEDDKAALGKILPMSDKP